MSAPDAATEAARRPPPTRRVETVAGGGPPTNDHRERTMAEQDDPLVLHGHRIVPAAVHEGSVRRWRCLDCGTEAADADAYLDVDCGADG